MQFKSILFAVFAAVLVAVTATGCAFFTPERIAAIHQTAATALQIAYEAGGKTALEAKIDEQVAAGKITPEQAVQLKAAAKKSYDALQAKLAELSVKDVTVEVTE